MLKNRPSSIVEPLIGLIVLLGIGYGAEILIERLKARNSQFFDVSYLIVWVYAAIPLIISAAILLLFWLVVFQRPRSHLIGIIYIVVGIFFTLNPILWVYGIPMNQLWGGDLPTALNPNSVFYMACAGISIIGLLCLILPRPNEKKENSKIYE